MNKISRTGFTRHTIIPGIVLVIIAFTLTMCFNITSVEQPETSVAGEEITITVHAEILDDPNNEAGPSVNADQFVFGFLAPKSWDVSENATVSISSVPFSNELVLMDEGEIEMFGEIPWTEALESRVGLGENYGLVEWVMFKATEVYNPEPEYLPLSGTVNITLTVGPENLITQLGYFVGDAKWGIRDYNKNFAFFFGECIEVTGGIGDVKNLCGVAPPETSSVGPEEFSWNDILTISFDATLGEGNLSTELLGASNVLMCSTANYSGGSDEVCSEMTSLGNDLWELSIWPTGHFDLPMGKRITSINYNFQNSDASITVGDPLNGGIDFFIEANCD